ncbi:hypothetical protein GCM10023082_05360 [Streptomyces tremellae]|uniref:Uncharacterized protein n=1 Tax=Streptomyces tremellae TaxID=1124239 RepID=A0ABP7E037_9ACTN
MSRGCSATATPATPSRRPANHGSSTPERWPSQEDHDGEQEPTRFECFWIPLETAHVLQSGQGALLGLLDA